MAKPLNYNDFLGGSLMNEYAEFIKKKLDTVLNEMQEYSWLLVTDPKKDFIRNRKLNFKEMLNILLSIGGNR